MKKNIYFLSIISCLIINSCHWDLPRIEEEGIEGEIQVSSTTIWAKCPIGFSTTANISNYQWNFGDNSISNEKNPFHSYTDSGNYTVILTDPNNPSHIIDSIPVNVRKPVKFNTPYGNSEDKAYSMVKSDNGEYVLTGITRENGTDDIIVMIIDSNGVEKNRFIYDYPGSERAWTITNTIDGGYIVGGWKLSKIFLLKLNSSFDLEWDSTYLTNLNGEVRAIYNLDNDEYLITGQAWDNSSTDVFIAKIESNGKMSWGNIYGRSNDDAAYAIEKTDDNNFLVAGYSASNTSNISWLNPDIYIIKIEPDGTQVWDTTYNVGKDETAHDIVRTNDGGFLITGSTNRYALESSDLYLIKLDNNGFFVDDEIYPLLGGGEINSIISAEDGDYVLCGYVFTQDKAEQGHLMKINDNLEINEAFSKKFGVTMNMNTNDRFYDLVGTDDCGFAMAGYTGDAIYLVKTDSEGNAE